MSNSVIPPTPDMQDYESESRVFSDMFSERDPFSLFETWMGDARESEINDPNAMSVATVDSDGLPDVRMLLLKGVDSRGFVFYTNENSAKGQHLRFSNKAALCFHWKSLKRSVRVRGSARPVSAEESDAYFSERARGSQIGAWASRQSSVIENREVLEMWVKDTEERFDGQTILRPPNWYGWRVEPESIEFWRDRPYRLHDRLVFRRKSVDLAWEKNRLSP